MKIRPKGAEFFFPEDRQTVRQTDRHPAGYSRFSQILRTRLEQSCAHPHEVRREAATNSSSRHCAVLHCASLGKSTERPYSAQLATLHIARADPRPILLVRQCCQLGNFQPT